MYIHGQKPRRSVLIFRTPGLFLGLALLSQGACTPQPEQETQAQVNQPPQPSVQATPSTGEVPPELLDNIISDLSTQGNYDKDAISVIRAESVIWPDGSLGCPKPGDVYTQAQVQGYWVVLRSSGKDFDYRASSTQYFYRCQNTFKIQPPVG
jgi:hypothetical protein